MKIKIAFWAEFVFFVSIFVAFFAAIAYGCVSLLEENSASSYEPKVEYKPEPEYLFERDGCYVYRFKDIDGFHYFTTCRESRYGGFID